MKRKALSVALLGGLMLTGCSGLAKTGSDVNSEVPAKLGSYKFITSEDVAKTGFCTGNLGYEKTTEKAGVTQYEGVFLYAKNPETLPRRDQNCSNVSPVHDTVDGVLFTQIWPTPHSSENCQVLDSGAYDCMFNAENTGFRMTMTGDVDQSAALEQMKEYASKLVTEAKFNIPENANVGWKH